MTETSDSGITLIEHMTSEIEKKRGQKAFWNVYRLVAFLKAITWQQHGRNSSSAHLKNLTHTFSLHIDKLDFLLNYVHYQMSISSVYCVFLSIFS